MSKGWESERLAVRQFWTDLDHRPSLPEASPQELEEHARQVARVQDALSMIAGMPPSKRPSVRRWDDVLHPLWRRLFAKGDDVDRYILADLWCPVLQQAGEAERYIRSCTAVAASARNFYLFDEALDYCLRARQAAGPESSAALANCINTEGMTHLCRKDYDSAESSYREALALADGLSDGELRRWTGLSKADFLAQGLSNILDARLRKGQNLTGAEQARLLPSTREISRRLDQMRMSTGFRQIVRHYGAERAILDGRLEEAKKQLSELLEEAGTLKAYQVSLVTMHWRVLSYVAQLEGDWKSAYHWIRLALREGVRHSYPSEEQFVLEQALAILRGLHGAKESRTREALVEDLVQLMEDKDWYTGRSHSRSVSRLALRLGEVLTQRFRWKVDFDTLRLGGLLHDIGKLRIPWSLLNKIAPITPREMRLLREHSGRGGELLRAIDMAEVATVVEQHHETLDGSGYPSGKPPLPLAAIVAVCDVYEATITPNRRYKQPKDRSVALMELKEGAGRLYDPSVVGALIHYVRKDRSS